GGYENQIVDGAIDGDTRQVERLCIHVALHGKDGALAKGLHIHIRWSEDSLVDVGSRTVVVIVIGSDRVQYVKRVVEGLLLRGLRRIRYQHPEGKRAYGRRNSGDVTGLVHAKSWRKRAGCELIGVRRCAEGRLQSERIGLLEIRVARTLTSCLSHRQRNRCALLHTSAVASHRDGIGPQRRAVADGNVHRRVACARRGNWIRTESNRG